MKDTQQIENNPKLILPPDAHNLITEIISLRKRLKQMGFTGDYADEKKMSGYFTEIIKQYEKALLDLKNKNQVQ